MIGSFRPRLPGRQILFRYSPAARSSFERQASAYCEAHEGLWKFLGMHVGKRNVGPKWTRICEDPPKSLIDDDVDQGEEEEHEEGYYS